MRVSHSFPSKSGASDGNEKTGGESVGTYCDGESASACVGVNTKYFSTLNADTLQAVKQLFINRQCKKLEEATAVRNTILPQFLRELTVAPPKPAGPLEYVSSPDTPNNERRSARSSCNDEKDQEQKTTANDMSQVLCAALRLYILSDERREAEGIYRHSKSRTNLSIAQLARVLHAYAISRRMELEADPSSLFLNGDSLEFAETLFQHANNLTLPPAACQPGGTTMARGAATEAGDDPIVIIPYKSRLEEEEEKNGIGEEDGLASNDGYGKEKFVEEFKKEVKEDEKAREQDVWGKLSNKERRRHLWAAASYAEIKIQSGDMDAAMSVARMYPNSKWLYGRIMAILANLALRISKASVVYVAARIPQMKFIVFSFLSLPPPPYITYIKHIISCKRTHVGFIFPYLCSNHVCTRPRNRLDLKGKGGLGRRSSSVLRLLTKIVIKAKIEHATVISCSSRQVTTRRRSSKKWRTWQLYLMIRRRMQIYSSICTKREEGMMAMYSLHGDQRGQCIISVILCDSYGVLCSPESYLLHHQSTPPP